MKCKGKLTEKKSFRFAVSRSGIAGNSTINTGNNKGKRTTENAENRGGFNDKPRREALRQNEAIKQANEELPVKVGEKLGRAFVWPSPFSPSNQPAQPNPTDTCSLQPFNQSFGVMDITDFIFSQREDVLLVGDYNAYRAHASRKLHKLRKNLGQTTPKGRKYTTKPPVSSENVGSNITYVRIIFGLLLQIC